jgi:uncharacterized protein (DUF305 family)
MVPHHRLGIDMLEHAQPRVDDVRVRRLVFEMSGYHSDELHTMETHLAHAGLVETADFPGHIDPERLTALEDATGPGYDVGWLVLMIEHHEGAVDLAEHELARVGPQPDDERRDLAQAIATTQTTEIDEMRTLARLLCAEHADLSVCDLVRPQP